MNYTVIVPAAFFGDGHLLIYHCRGRDRVAYTSRAIAAYSIPPDQTKVTVVRVRVAATELAVSFITKWVTGEVKWNLKLWERKGGGRGRAAQIYCRAPLPSCLRNWRCVRPAVVLPQDGRGRPFGRSVGNAAFSRYMCRKTCMDDGRGEVGSS